MNHNQIIEAWNTQSDVQNQWYVLGEDEKVEFAFAIGAAESKAEIERLKVYEQEAMYMAEKTGCLAADVLADNYLLATSELEAEIERLKATMRQSLRLLREAAPNGYGLGSEQEAAVAAIKQHLGEV